MRSWNLCCHLLLLVAPVRTPWEANDAGPSLSADTLKYVLIEELGQKSKSKSPPTFLILMRGCWLGLAFSLFAYGFVSLSSFLFDLTFISLFFFSYYYLFFSIFPLFSFYSLSFLSLTIGFQVFFQKLLWDVKTKLDFPLFPFFFLLSLFSVLPSRSVQLLPQLSAFFGLIFLSKDKPYKI